MILGIIINVVDAYWYGRLNTVSGYMSINEGGNDKLNSNKFYAAVQIKDDIIKVRNIFNEHINETNIYYKDLSCNGFVMSDDNEILSKWIKKNTEKKYDFYIIEYKVDSNSLTELKSKTMIDISNLQTKLEILEKLDNKNSKTLITKVFVEIHNILSNIF